jgi:serine phosphatase RsbU (regulator of sigma subunit)
MITAAAQGAVTTLLEMSGGNFALPQLLQGMNAAIHAAAKGKFVMTCFASMYDPETRNLIFANAGHNFPYLFDAEKGKLASLVVRGNRLGDIVTSDYETKSIQVGVNDSLIWYTDGIIECENLRGEEYGERRFRSVIMKNASLSPDQALNGIVDRAVEFYGEVPQKDDITLVLGKLG